MKFLFVLAFPMLLLFAVTPIPIEAQTPSQFIHLNQIGYLPTATKVAVLSNPQVGFNSADIYTPATQLQVRDANTDAILLNLSPVQWNSGATHEQSGDEGYWVDFSSFTQLGDFYLFDPDNNERSAVFTIGFDVYERALYDACRMFFYNRCNFAKSAPYAEANWTDALAFSNPLQDLNCRYIHDPTNASLEKDLSGGWFDAGDYNKYVTYTYTTLHDLLWAYEENPEAFSDATNIPESSNGLPDLLDEVKWELEWLMKMNNSDGTTHLKMGSRNYSENTASPPSANTDPRYYGPTCTSASVAVASVFAHAAKVFSKFPTTQSFAQQLETRAIASWAYVEPLLRANNL